MRIAALLDYHDGQKKLVDELERSGLLPAGHVLKTSHFAEQAEADIEDLLGREMFRHLFNGCMQLAAPHAFPAIKPAATPIRLIKEADEWNATLPAGMPEFDHYMPVEFLNRIPATEISDIPGLESALERFEKLCVEINTLTVAPPTP